MNFTTPGDFINSTDSSIWRLNDLEMCVLYINLLFTFPAHSYVIWLIMTKTGIGVALEFFNLSLSVCEIGNCLNSLLITMSNWNSFPFVELSKFLQGLTITGRPLFQCLICVERYLAVVHPVTFLKYKPLRYRAISWTVAWIIAVGSCFYFMLLLMFSTSGVLAWSFLFHFLLFLSIQLFCLVAVLRALKQSGPGERGGNHMKRRAFYLILLTTVTMLITSVQYTTLALFNTLTQQTIPKLWLTFTIYYVLASFVQPIHYLHSAGKLSCLCKILHCPVV